MNKNLYYRTTFRRENIAKSFFLGTFNMFASGSRLLLEVFIRKNFGERYFRLSHVLRLSAELILIPFIPVLIRNVLISSSASSQMMYSPDGFPSSTPDAMAVSWWPGSKYLLWYVFVAAFIGISIKHYIDKRTQPSVFDFKKFSLSSGELQPFMSKLPFFDKVSIRVRECFLEPAVFLIIGLVLTLIGQYVGWLLMICSFFYCVAYLADYERGDNFIMDRIDEIICNRVLEQDFVNAVDIHGDGFEFRGMRPNGEDYRRQILETMFTEDEVLIAQ